MRPAANSFFLTFKGEYLWVITPPQYLLKY